MSTIRDLIPYEFGGMVDYVRGSAIGWETFPVGWVPLNRRCPRTRGGSRARIGGGIGGYFILNADGNVLFTAGENGAGTTKSW